MSPIISFTSLTASSPNLPYKWANCYSEGMNSNKTTSVIRQTREKVFYHLPNTENMGPTMAVCLTWYKQNSKVNFFGHNVAGGNRRWRDEPKADPKIFIRSSVPWKITVPSFFHPQLWGLWIVTRCCFEGFMKVRKWLFKASKSAEYSPPSRIRRDSFSLPFA